MMFRQRVVGQCGSRSCRRHGISPSQVPQYIWLAVPQLLSFYNPPLQHSMLHLACFYPCRLCRAVPCSAVLCCALLLGGESDVRSCYTAMAVATSLCLDVKALAAKAGMVDYVRRCQVGAGGASGFFTLSFPFTENR